MTELVLGESLPGEVAAPGERLHHAASASASWCARLPIWPYALCALISITSKYVLRVEDRHIWNPSNFGISRVAVSRCRTGGEPQHPVGQLSAAR